MKTEIGTCYRGPNLYQSTHTHMHTQSPIISTFSTCPLLPSSHHTSLLYSNQTSLYIHTGGMHPHTHTQRERERERTKKQRMTALTNCAILSNSDPYLTLEYIHQRKTNGERDGKRETNTKERKKEKRK